ncbi:Uncharacterised protein [uncultured archaeon]|nr:Uncharacterised protein [uncultured archaeon]
MNNPINELSMFVCTFVCQLSNFSNMKIQTILDKFKLTNSILAINSNYGSLAQDGYSKLCKSKRKRKNMRKLQGNGTSFNSALEVCVRINSSINPSIIKEKNIYKMKCFPSSGKAQITGVLLENYDDANAVISEFVDFLKLNGYDNIEALNKCPNMLNYKTTVNLRENEVIDLMKLYKLILKIHDKKPRLVKEVKPPFELLVVSFGVVVRHPTTHVKKTVRVKIFQKGKINVLGCVCKEHAEKVKRILVQTFTDHWKSLVFTVDEDIIECPYPLKLLST